MTTTIRVRSWGHPGGVILERTALGLIMGLLTHSGGPGANRSIPC